MHYVRLAETQTAYSNTPTQTDAPYTWCPFCWAVLPHTMPMPLQQNWCLAMDSTLVNISASIASVLI